MTDFPALPPPGLFLVLVGPSGAGKSTVIDAFLVQAPDFARCLSVTTRAPRGAERDGVDYHFVSEAEFARRVAAGEFLEHATVFGRHSYGTPRGFVADRIAAGRSVVKDVDVQGAAQIRRSFPAAVLAFLVPPTRADIEARLRGRGTDAPEAVARRLAEAEREIERWREHDYLVVNDRVEDAARTLLALVAAERCRIGRVPH